MPEVMNFLKLGIFFNYFMLCVFIMFDKYLLYFFALGKPRNYSWKMDSCSCKWVWSENNWLYSEVCDFILLLWSSNNFDWSHLVNMFISWDITGFVCCHHEVFSLPVFVAVFNFSLIWPQADVNLIFTGSGLGDEVILCIEFKVCVGQ